MMYTLKFCTMLAVGGVPKTTLSDWRIIVGITLLFICFVLYARTRKRIQQNQKKFQWQASEPETVRSEGNVIYSQIQNLMAELAELSRQINGQIDTRLAKLELLIREADRKLAQLEEGSGRPVQPTAPFVNPRQSAQPKPPGSADREPRALGETFNQSTNPADLEVMQLFEKGLAPVAIAQRLNRPLGEIELILTLKGKKPKNGGKSL